MALRGDFGGGGGFAEARDVLVGRDRWARCGFRSRTAQRSVPTFTPCVRGAGDLFEVGVGQLAWTRSIRVPSLRASMKRVCWRSAVGVGQCRGAFCGACPRRARAWPRSRWWRWNFLSRRWTWSGRGWGEKSGGGLRDEKSARRPKVSVTSAGGNDRFALRRFRRRVSPLRSRRAAPPVNTGVAHACPRRGPGNRRDLPDRRSLVPRLPLAPDLRPHRHLLHAPPRFQGHCSQARP